MMASVRAIMARATVTATFAVTAFAGPRPAVADPPSYATGDETIAGTISALSGKYDLVLQDQRGFNDSVTLHDGTVISPGGTTLQTGEAVSIVGHADGKTFDADEIDLQDADSNGATGVSTPAGDTGPIPGSQYYYGPYGGNAYPGYVIPYGSPGFFNGQGGLYGSPYGPCCYGASPGYFYYVFPAQSNPAQTSGTHGSTPVTSHSGVPISHPPVIRHAPTTPVSRSTFSGSYGGASRAPSGSSRR
jgi:hypothetical protein